MTRQVKNSMALSFDEKVSGYLASKEVDGIADYLTKGPLRVADPQIGDTPVSCRKDSRGAVLIVLREAST